MTWSSATVLDLPPIIGSIGQRLRPVRVKENGVQEVSISWVGTLLFAACWLVLAREQGVARARPVNRHFRHVFSETVEVRQSQMAAVLPLCPSVANVVAPAGMQTATRKALVALSCITACSSVLLASTQHPLDPLEVPVVQATPQTPSPSLSPSFNNTLARQRLFQSGSPAEPHIPNRTPPSAPGSCWGLSPRPNLPRCSHGAKAPTLPRLCFPCWSFARLERGRRLSYPLLHLSLPAGASTSRAMRQRNGRSHSGRGEIGGFTVGDFCTTFWIKLKKKPARCPRVN